MEKRNNNGSLQAPSGPCLLLRPGPGEHTPRRGRILPWIRWPWVVIRNSAGALWFDLVTRRSSRPISVFPDGTIARKHAGSRPPT